MKLLFKKSNYIKIIIISIKYAYFQTYYILIFMLLNLSLRIRCSFSEKIDNIIQLGGRDFRYNHFSLNSKGDMIIDTTAYPGNNQRRFFGLKKNGRPYFVNENNIETPYHSLFAYNLENENQQKLEGESNFIILSKQNYTEINGIKEYLLSFSILDNYMELYDFEKNQIIAVKTSSIFDPNITSNVNSFIKSASTIDNNYNYYISYINNSGGEYKFYMLRCYFTSLNLTNGGYHLDTGSRKTTINNSITSCFETELKKIACFYQATNDKYRIVAFNETATLNSETQGYTTFSKVSSNDEKKFFKAIHLKKEIGIFIFYNSSNDNYPIVSLKKCAYEDNQFSDYKNYGEIKVNKMSFNSHAMTNDIIKLNDNKFCFISTSSNKQSLIIVIFNIYDNDNYMTIRYYSYDMYEKYGIIFFKDLRAFSFNNYLSVAFSHCPNTNCAADDDEHYSSLIIFNFPNNTNDEYADLLDYSYYTNNHFDNYSFIIGQNMNCNIENNIFGYSCKGIKIINYPENTKLFYKNNGNILERNSFLIENENLSLIFNENDEYREMNYTIEYAFVAIEPEYSHINDYISFIDNDYGNNQLENEGYQQMEYIGRSVYFNLTINEDIISNCNDKCLLCYKRDINYCVICKYNYTFSNNEKKCFANPLLETTIPITTFYTITTLITPSSFLYTTSLTETPPSTLIQSSTIIASPTTFNEFLLSSSLSSGLSSSTTISISSDSPELISSSSFISITSTILKDVPSSILQTTLITVSPTSSRINFTSIPNSLTTLIIQPFVPQSTLSELPNSQTPDIYSTLLVTNLINGNPDTSSQGNIISTVIRNNLKCSNVEIIGGKCNEIIENEQIEEVYDYIKENIIKDFNKTNNTNIIIETKNVIFQVSTIEEQENNINISSVTLGECEEIIKEKENLTEKDELIIYKIDIKSIDLSLTYVQYEIYNPYTLELIPLNVCESASIKIKAPVKLDEELKSLYENLNSSGYNLFDLNDSFYNDVCSTYTTENGTDISMVDRKDLYDSNTNISLCQSGCTFLSYDNINERVECECEVQTEETSTNVDELGYDSLALVNILFEPLKYSNFLVMKCFKLLLSKEGQIGNIGSYIMSTILFIFILCFIWYQIQGNKIIDKYILSFISPKKLNSCGKIDNMTEESIKRNFEHKEKEGQGKPKKKSKKLQINNNNNINIYINQINKANKKKAMTNKNNPLKKKRNNKESSKIINESSVASNQLMKSEIIRQNSKLAKKNTLFLIKRSKTKVKINKKRALKKYKSIRSNLNNDNNINYDEKNKYTDLEMNEFDYKTAIILDKRTYFQYYVSLIKRKQLICFAFCQGLDYNIFQVKVCLLLFSFSLNFTIEGFFFSDDTMNKIYIDNGEYDLKYQVPQLLYSFLISIIINYLLKKLSLTEREFLALKHEKNPLLLKMKAAKNRKNVKIRILCFYLISFLCMLFFWYFISCFCAVYKNTQILLLYDTLISFGISLLYPFAYYLLPGMFRIPSLKANNKDNNTLYFIGTLIAML